MCYKDHPLKEKRIHPCPYPHELSWPTFCILLDLLHQYSLCLFWYTTGRAPETQHLSSHQHTTGPWLVAEPRYHSVGFPKTQPSVKNIVIIKLNVCQGPICLVLFFWGVSVYVCVCLLFPFRAIYLFL